MKEHKLRQKIYHANCSITGHADDLEVIARSEPITVLDSDFEGVVASTISHFTVEQPRLIYPSKSYFVAIIYAFLLQKHFGEGVYKSLSDPDLLFGNDRYFLPYGIAAITYDAVIDAVQPVIDKIVAGDLDGLPTQIPSTVGYFNAEFQITA